MGQRIIISEEERKDIQFLYEEFNVDKGYVLHQNTKFTVTHPSLGELCINKYDGNEIGIGKRMKFFCSPTVMDVEISADKKRKIRDGLTASINNNRPFNFETEQGSLTFKKVKV